MSFFAVLTVHAFPHHAVADNPLGDATLGELRRHGVDAEGVLRRGGRMGLYFLASGAGLRPSEVLYDRVGSMFALTDTSEYDWSQLLAGAVLLHISGVTPALGQATADAALADARAARAAGTLVSFDGNFRPTLWAAWGSDPRAILHALIAEADNAADHDEPSARFAAAAGRAFTAFPRLRRIATTVRLQHSVDDHSMSALMATRHGALHVAPTHALHGIIDHIGAGDAFSAGVMHGFLDGMADADSLHFGLAAACLKHSIPGDFNLADRDDMLALMRNERLDVKR